MKKLPIICFLIIVPVLMQAFSVAAAGGPEAFSMAWAEFRFKNQELYNIQAPVVSGQAGEENMIGDGQFLLAQNQANETEDSAMISEQVSTN